MRYNAVFAFCVDKHDVVDAVQTCWNVN
jgi:hypothetical protein